MSTNGHDCWYTDELDEEVQVIRPTSSFFVQVTYVLGGPGEVPVPDDDDFQEV